MTVRTKLSLALFLAGFAGILSFLFIDVAALAQSLPVTAGAPLPMSPWVIKLVSLIQPTVLVAAAVLIGVALAPKVGLSAPAFEAWARGDSIVAALRPQLLPGLVGGIIGGVAVVSSWVVARQILPSEFAQRAEQMNRILPLPTRLLYGGITEEVLLRWGLLTLLVWLSWRFLQRARGEPRAVYLVSAILVSSIIFGLGHLPIAVALGSRITLAIFLYVVIANAIFGLIAGYLYWREGLEAAILAHMLVHVGIVTASYVVR